MAGDMSAVATAARLDRFALLGISQGCAFSVRYAVEHPDQVDASKNLAFSAAILILFAGVICAAAERTDEGTGRVLGH